MRKPLLSFNFALALAAGSLLVCSGFSCGGGGAATAEGLFIAPDFIQGEASGMIVVGEKARGKIWMVSAENLEVPEQVGVDGKKATLPVLDLGATILELRLSPDGNTLILLAEGEGGPVLRSYETQGFQEQGSLDLADYPLDFVVANGGELYLLPGGAGGTGNVARLPKTLSYAEAQTLAVIPEPQGLELSPDGGHLLLRYGPGEDRFGWLGLADFNQVTDLTWTPELSGVGAYRAIFFTTQAYPGGAVMIVPDGQDQAYKFSLDQTESTTKLDLKGLTGGMEAGALSGDPVLIWVTLAGYLYLYDFATQCYGNFEQYVSRAGTAAFTDELPLSGTTLGKIKTSECLGITRTETWTVTYTEAGWQVAGTVSGPQTGLAQEGEVYATPGGEVSFLLSAGENPASAGDLFTFSTADGISGIYVGAVSPDLYLDEARGLVWVADTPGGRVLAVDPLTGSVEKIIY
ncbi:MAG: hypothetical protein NT009_03005 [Proteobacteria bacterium]|nr:hypothetical protein [Pseudomonadota bacterium]